MPEILARWVCWVLITYYWNLGFSRRRWEGHGTSNYAYRACEILLHANFNAKPLWGHPSITSEKIIDDTHGKNPCMLTNIENVADMS